MRNLGYYIIRYWMAISLFCYYRKITVVGKKNIPARTPVLFLSNHQNALMDILIIATNCSRKPWYLTRADVFKSKVLRPFFTFLQMLPVYRMRDGKANLKKNDTTFNLSGELLNQKQAILLFPEANHSLKRRVRPLSKGFTRLIFSALKQNPKLDITLVPIGQNYQDASTFPDSAAIYYGKPIKVQPLIAEDKRLVINTIKHEVSQALQGLTTHIQDEANYEAIHNQLQAQQQDFTKPIEVNATLVTGLSNKRTMVYPRGIGSAVRVLFVVWNLPMIWLWRTFLKPKVPEMEFMDTFRFGFCAVGFPLFYAIALGTFSYALDLKTACLGVLGHAVFNLCGVKFLLPTSYRQKR